MLGKASTTTAHEAKHHIHFTYIWQEKADFSHMLLWTLDTAEKTAILYMFLFNIICVLFHSLFVFLLTSLLPRLPTISTFPFSFLSVLLFVCLNPITSLILHQFPADFYHALHASYRCFRSLHLCALGLTCISQLSCFMTSGDVHLQFLFLC